jgi:excisionase family DNA binding protein
MIPQAAEIAPAEAAALLGIALPTLLRLAGRGELRLHRLAGTTVLRRAEVLAWRDRQVALRREALAVLAQLSETHEL